MHKRFLALFVALMLGSALLAQPHTKTAIAPFKITTVNGKVYTYKQLKPGVPTALIYFSPTCEHCKDFTKELLKHEKELAKLQLVMVGYEPVSEMKKFDSVYHLSAKPFIHMGTEGYTFIVQKYYGVQRFPFVALYNKQQKLQKILSPVSKPDQLVSEILSLN